jgi:hypothetical protein
MSLTLFHFVIHYHPVKFGLSPHRKLVLKRAQPILDVLYHFPHTNFAITTRTALYIAVLVGWCRVLRLQKRQYSRRRLDFISWSRNFWCILFIFASFCFGTILIEWMVIDCMVFLYYHSANVTYSLIFL